jgi:hypothetical protein
VLPRRYVPPAGSLTGSGETAQLAIPWFLYGAYACGKTCNISLISAFALRSFDSSASYSCAACTDRIEGV